MPSMKYGFIEDVFRHARNSSKCKELREELKYKRYLIASTVIILYYSLLIFFASLKRYQHLGFIAAVGVSSTVLLLFLEISRKLPVPSHYAIFSLLIMIQIYMNVSLQDKTTLIAGFSYVQAFLTSFFLPILLQPSASFNIVFGILNTITIGLRKYCGIETEFILFELLLLCLVYFAFLIIKKEVETISENIKYLETTSNLGLRYIDSLVSQTPCLFFSYSDSKIVFTNSRAKEFLMSKFSDASVGVFRELVHGEYAYKNNTVKLFENHCEKEITMMLNSISQKFLSTVKMSTEENCKINPKLIISPNMPLFEILEKYNNIYLPTGDMNMFEYIGTFEYNNESDLAKEKYSFNAYIKKNTLQNFSWTEVLLYDITMSKKIEFLDDIIKLKEKVLSKIAHEFKTPLICLISLSESLSFDFKKGSGLKMKQVIRQINDLSNYTLYLLNDISTYLNNNCCIVGKILKGNFQSDGNCFPKNETGNKFSLKLKYISLSVLLKFSFRILQTLLMYKSDKITLITPLLEIDSELSNVEFETDELRVKQILLNLISNAVKFTQRGMIKIKASVKENIVTISVIDTGIGISQKDMSNLFKDYKMITSSLVANEMGSGLGLSISKQYAELLGYKLQVDSGANGSTFSLVILLNENEVNHLLADVKGNPKEKKTNLRVIPKMIKKDYAESDSLSENPVPTAKKRKSKLTKCCFESFHGEIKNNVENNNNNNNHSNDNHIDSDNNLIKLIEKPETRMSSFLIEKSGSEIAQSIRDFFFKKAKSHSQVYKGPYDSSNSLTGNSVKTTKKAFKVSTSKFMKFIKKIKSDQQEDNNNNNNNELYYIDKPIQNHFRRNSAQVKDTTALSKVSNNDYQFSNVVPFDSNLNIRIKHHSTRDIATCLVPPHYQTIGSFPEIVQCKKTKKIVIIDDIPLILNSLENRLKIVLERHQLYDTEIIKGTDGVDLLKMVIDDQKQGNSIVCVLSDENMEFLNGSETIRIIRNLEQKRKVRPIFCSICSGDNISDSENLANYYLEKNPSVEALTELLEKCGMVTT